MKLKLSIVAALMSVGVLQALPNSADASKTTAVAEQGTSVLFVQSAGGG